jgi:Carboxypeptidase regulatory-like domain
MNVQGSSRRIAYACGDRCHIPLRRRGTVNQCVRFACVLGALGLLTGCQDSAALAVGERWHMKGRVVDSRMQPIAGAGILLAPVTTSTRQVLATPAVRTDRHGRFQLSVSLESFQNGYRIRVAARGRMAMATIPAAESVEWDGSREIWDLGDIVLGPGASIIGTVRSEDGKPVAGARVIGSDVLHQTQRMFLDVPGPFLSSAVTDARGAFVLPGVSLGGARLEIYREGFHRHRLPFVPARGPVAITLLCGGFVEGVVLSPDGRPRPSKVSIRYEAKSPGVLEYPHPVDTDPRGAFRLNLDYPGGYRVTVDAEVGPKPLAESRLLQAAGKGVKIIVPAAEKGREVVVHVSSLVNGEAKDIPKGAWAACAWIDRETWNWRHWDTFSRPPIPMREPGTIRLPGPGEGEPDTGIIVVRAKGYAPAILKGITWSSASPPRLEARLVRESIVSGIVVDVVGGEPLPMARVTIQPEFDGPGQTLEVDARGRFRIAGLAAGKYGIHAAYPQRPDTKPIQIVVGESQEHTDVKIPVATGATLRGKLIGVKPAPGWLVIREPDRPAAMGVFVLGESAPSVPVAGDGSFSITGLADGRYELSLAIPHREGRGGFLQLPIGWVLLERSDSKRTFDITELAPAIIRGKVKINGDAGIPLERLIVSAVTPGRVEMGLQMPDEVGVYEQVARDGSFVLPVRPGVHRIDIMDAATGVVLAKRTGVKLDPAAELRLDLSLDVAKVRVGLQPAKGSESISLTWLEIVTDSAAETAMALTSPSDVGVSLAEGSRDVSFYVPVRPIKLRVWSRHGGLEGAFREHQGARSLGKHEFLPKSGETTRIEIRVRIPKLMVPK